MNKPVDEYRLAQKLNIKPSIAHLESSDKEILDSFKSTILLAYEDEIRKDKIYLDIDYPLYELLTKVQKDTDQIKMMKKMLLSLPNLLID
ncbi:hypothetical protein ACI2OX_03805 [Bacillus sp. N9]